MSSEIIENLVPAKVRSSTLALRYDLDELNHNARICGVLNSTVLNGGKRLRPVLSFMMADLFALSHDSIASYSRAVEMIHASSLAHDDVIDCADQRRGRPSINVVSSNKKAILAGDYLLAHVLKDACARGNLAIVNQLSQTIADLAEGEWLQIENREKTRLKYEDIELVALKKTGSVMRLCCIIPAILAVPDAKIHQLCATFGEKLGIAFQLSDDLLDFRRQDGCAYQDLVNGVINAVMFAALSSRDKGQAIDATSIDVTELDPVDFEPGFMIIEERLLRLKTELESLLAQIIAAVGHGIDNLASYEQMQQLIAYICTRNTAAQIFK